MYRFSLSTPFEHWPFNDFRYSRVGNEIGNSESFLAHEIFMTIEQPLVKCWHGGLMYRS